MDASSDRPPPRPDSSKPPERRGSSRPAPEGRRKRSADQRYAGWNDGLERTFCALATHALPTTFPVASHSGIATIAPAVVAHRPDALLLCTFTHCGPHVWPDGEAADEPSPGDSANDTPSQTAETAGDR